ncbi:pol [Symbiodinium natans]|uniref:Pol protein n=1 Tax=Symbiodinium natans TaxID=878477 RepID=A0A812KVB6_9DINO|nr:pol [Symbiodinium natans]
MDTARSLGFLHAAQRGAGPALTDSIRSTASDALAKGKVVLGLGNSEGCFSQLAAKSRGLSCFQGLAGRDLAAAPADGASAAHAHSGSVQRAATATVARTPSRRNKGPAPARSSPVKEAEFLAGGPYIQAAQTLLGSGAAEDVIYIRAYSLDCPSCIEAIEASLGKGASVRIVADMGQCHRTKLQWQALKRLAAAGAEVKVGCGTSLRDAYARDGRGAKVGTGIQGLHHAKALCLLRPDGAVVLIGSLNFTTSSKANAEAGLKLEVPKTHPVAQSYVEDFQRVSAEAFSLDEAVAKRPQLERASSSNVAGNATRAPNTAPQGIE